MNNPEAELSGYQKKNSFNLGNITINTYPFVHSAKTNLLMVQYRRKCYMPEYETLILPLPLK